MDPKAACLISIMESFVLFIAIPTRQWDTEMRSVFSTRCLWIAEKVQKHMAITPYRLSAVSLNVLSLNQANEAAFQPAYFWWNNASVLNMRHFKLAFGRVLGSKAQNKTHVYKILKPQQLQLKIKHYEYYILLKGMVLWVCPFFSQLFVVIYSIFRTVI